MKVKGELLNCKSLNSATDKLQKETDGMRVLIASSNKGKLRDFAAVASLHGVEVQLIPNFALLPIAVEDGETFEENARKKAEHYSQYLPGELVLADDSGLAVDALSGAPGVRSARYASDGDEEDG